MLRPWLDRVISKALAKLDGYLARDLACAVQPVEGIVRGFLQLTYAEGRKI